MSESIQGAITMIFKCAICENRFAQRPDLYTLILLAHEGTSLFKCAICETRLAEESYFFRKEKILSNEQFVTLDLLKKPT